MFPTWRLRLKEVRMAARSGRYDEAAALLERASLREFLPAKRLAEDVAGKIIARADERFQRGDSAAGWQDLAVADRLGGQAAAIGKLRGVYTDRAISEVERYLSAGQTAPALARLEKLERKGLLGDRGRNLREVARLMHNAERAASHGHFAAARTAITRAKRLADEQRSTANGRPGDGTMSVRKQLDERERQSVEREADVERLAAELHAALAGQDWSAALTAAGALLAIAPQHQAAQQARRQAWKAVGMDVTRAYQGARAAGNISIAVDRLHGRKSTRAVNRCSEVDTVFGSERPRRMLLWIDAVGGYLVALDDHVILGQPSPGQPIAVPFLADLSRRHAVIRRESGAYVLEPVQETRVDGQRITGPTVLADGQLIQLGESVRLRFRKPHALSATARLDIESHHKTQPSADAILLLADSCVMGPSRHCHVKCRDWEQDVVLYRQGDQICCRSSAPLSVDGTERSGSVEIGPRERVEGADFSFSWEEVE